MTQYQLLMMSGFVVLMAMSLGLIGLSRRRPVVSIDERLAHFAERPVSLEDEELQRPFSQRILLPILKKIVLRLSTLTPARNTEKVRQQLAEAGNPSGIGVAEFVGLRLFLALALSLGSFVLFSISGGGGMLLMMMPICLAIFGFMLPGIWVGRKAKARKKEIQRSLPDAIDLLTISVESGLGFDPAIMRVAEKWDNSLTREFARVLSEMRIGKSKREALREMSLRCNVDDLSTFVSAVIQADQLGVAISQVLRIQSEAMRVRRRQRAEELAHKAPIKMLFPMAFLIFPALYVIILGPAVPRVIEAFK
jgi:tight adherence protein C